MQKAAEVQKAEVQKAEVQNAIDSEPVFGNDTLALPRVDGIAPLKCINSALWFVARVRR